MKKVTLTIAALVFMTYIVSAQTDYSERLSIGLKAGINYSNVYNSEGEEFDTDPKFGFVAGGFLSIPIGKFLGVQPEVLFSQKGFKATGKFLTNTYTFTRTTSFIDIPILIQLKPSEYVTILAGPQYSYLVNRKDEFGNISQKEYFKNENVRKNLFCFLGGFDINYDHFVFGARVGWDITKNNGDGTSTTPRYKNVWYQATVGLRF